MNPIKRNFGGAGTGVVAGIVGTLLVLALAIAAMFFAMGRCPMCGSMMN